MTTEATQRQAEEILDLYNHAPCGYHSLDKHGVVIRMNDTELHWLGYTRAEVVGKMRLTGLLAAGSHRTFEEKFPLKVSGCISEYEVEMLRKDGSVFSALISATLAKDADGNFLMSRSTVQDITERKRAEVALIHARTHYRTLLKAATDGIHVLNRDGELVDASDSFYRMLGYAPDEAPRLRVADWDAQWSVEELRVRIADLLERPAVFETRHRCRDGRTIDVEINARGVEVDGQVYLYASARDITERRKLGLALKESEQRYRRLFEVESDAIVLVDLETKQFVDANPAALSLYGYDRPEFLTLPHYALSAEPEKTTQAVVREETFVALRWHRKKDGSVFPVEIAGVYFAVQGRKFHVAAIRDITQRQRTEEALRQSARLNELLRQGIVAINACPDFDAAIAGLLRQAIKLAGVDCGCVYVMEGREAVLRREMGFHPEFARRVARRPLTTDFIKAALENPQEIYDVLERFPDRRPLGELYGLRHVYCIGLSAGRAPFGILNLASTRAEAPGAGNMALIRILALETESLFVRLGAEQRLRSVLTTMAEGVVHQAADGTILDCNPSAERILGLSRDQIMGAKSIDPLWRATREDGSAFPGEEHPAMVSLKTGQPCENAVMGLRLPDGSQKWININAQPMFRTGEDRPYAVVTSFADITHRKIAEEALREGESRFQALFDQSLVGAALVETATGRWTRVNQRFCDLLGYTAEELLDMTYQAVTHPEDLAKSLDAVRRMVSGEVKHQSIEKRYVRKDGSVVWGNLTMLPLWKVGRASDYHLSLIEDSTARRHLEERLRQSQKMEGIGHLAGGMAHEFNNILAALLMHLNLVKLLCEQGEVHDLVGEMEELSHRAANLIKQLLAFSRQSVMKPKPMDLAAALLGQRQMLSPLLGESITLECALGNNLSWVNADQSMIEQVLMNLCLNARDAMKAGGLIRLELEEVGVESAQVAAQEGVQPGKYLRLSVADTGCGMDEPTLKRLFEPFFTTKDIGQGTGLGLATVRGIVQQHRGWVEVESSVGKGSTFRVYLPAVAQPAAAPPAPAPKVLVRGKGTILLVEDEPTLRKATRRLFAGLGYAVLETANGAEALEAWDAHRTEIDLLFTDMVMPGNLTGLQLAQKALADQPRVKAIITSGYNTDQLDLNRIADLSIVYLPKPCDLATLTSVIKKCLLQE